VPHSKGTINHLGDKSDQDKEEKIFIQLISVPFSLKFGVNLARDGSGIIQELSIVRYSLLCSSVFPSSYSHEFN
ncbi:MAG TPA: hypothetical protein PLB18_24935, partial [Acidobacteriota bacterium]|nr:hypothetical protein [Acidobacteriota bacterium]